MTSLPSPSHEVTRLLFEWSEGNQAALDKLVPMVYDELRRLAHQYLAKERRGRTLETSELVHEAYLRLVSQHHVQWQSRAHFYGIAAELMRRVLVDRARRRGRIKRGRGVTLITIDQSIISSGQPKVDVIEIDEALTRLAQIDQRKARIVELRFFGGLEVDETATFLNISERTVMREWKLAKAWLHRELSCES
jgi:RNA polymerase sigma-70 factor, ECF subfamily